jgi:hypothetical protein
MGRGVGPITHFTSFNTDIINLHRSGSTMLHHHDPEPVFGKWSPSGSTGYAGRVPGVEALVSVLYDLKEPWRGRFLALVHFLSTGIECNGRLPAHDEVRTWLAEDPMLRSEVRQLVEAWTQASI